VGKEEVTERPLSNRIERVKFLVESTGGGVPRINERKNEEEEEKLKHGEKKRINRGAGQNKWGRVIGINTKKVTGLTWS